MDKTQKSLDLPSQGSSEYCPARKSRFGLLGNDVTGTLKLYCFEDMRRFLRLDGYSGDHVSDHRKT